MTKIVPVIFKKGILRMLKNKLLLVIALSSLLSLGACSSRAAVTSSSSEGAASSSVSTSVSSSAPTASSSKPLTQYTITFKNEDGSVLSNEKWAEGSTPKCATPSKASDDTYDYYFQGWDPEIVPVSADATYTATYIRSVKVYSDGLTYLAKKDGYMVRSYTGSDTDVVIPAYHEDAPVTSLADELFFQNQSITSLSLPMSLTDIGYLTFKGASALKSFSVDSLNATYASDGRALYDKEETTLLAYALASGTSYAMPNTVTAIDDYAFNSAKTLTDIAFSTSLTSIGDSSFSFCRALTSVTLPETLTSIGKSAFASCTAIASINFPSALTHIGSGAFTGVNVQKAYEDTLRYLGDSANPYVILENNSDKSLATASVHEGCKVLDFQLFSNCASLTSVSLPKSITDLDEQVFAGTSVLTSLTYAGTKEDWAKVELGKDWTKNSALTSVTCSDGSVTL